MTKKQKRYRNLMYVQFADVLAMNFPGGYPQLNNYLHENFSDYEWAYIMHDKDIGEDGNLINNHIHLAISYPNARSVDSLANDMGDKPQYVEFFEGRWGKQNMFAYLIHATDRAKEEGKHEYDVDDVVSNFNYKEYIEGVKSTAAKNKLSIDEVKTKILNGSLILKDFYRDSELGDKETLAGFYADNKRIIDTYIETRYKMQMTELGGADLEVIYIQGEAGSGKTMLAKEFAKRKYGDYFMTGSSNDSVQDYMGEPVAIFDDARPSDFNASDWLKLLDPYNNKTSVTSRYYNKFLAVKCIILTTTTPFEEFFVYAKDKGDVEEPVSQFMRRFQLVIKVEPDEDAFGEKYAIGDLYTVERLDESVQSLVGQSWIDYNHELVKVNETIKVKIPKGDNFSIAKDILKYF